MKNKTRRTPVSETLQPLTTTIAPTTRRRLEEIARSEHRNLSQVVRIALDEFLQLRKNYPALPALVERARPAGRRA